MNKKTSIKKNYQFRYIFKNAKANRLKYTNIYIIKNRYKRNRLGITLNTNIKGAVNRNRAKRLVRESMNLLNKKLKKGFDIVINLNIFYKDLKSNIIYSELDDFFKKMDMINEKDNN